MAAGPGHVSEELEQVYSDMGECKMMMVMMISDDGDGDDDDDDDDDAGIESIAQGYGFGGPNGADPNEAGENRAVMMMVHSEKWYQVDTSGH